jgi:hypothetical protein
VEVQKMADRSPIASGPENLVSINFVVTNRTVIDVRSSEPWLQCCGRGGNGRPHHPPAGVGECRRRWNAEKTQHESTPVFLGRYHK